MVSIIIPCYNSGKYISECLNSILAQTYSDWEAICVNDGSTDNTMEFVHYELGKSSVTYLKDYNFPKAHCK